MFFTKMYFSPTSFTNIRTAGYQLGDQLTPMLMMDVSLTLLETKCVDYRFVNVTNITMSPEALSTSPELDPNQYSVTDSQSDF